MNFSHGEEILGFYGKIVEETRKTLAGEKYNHHFVSLGVIVNECDNFSLSEFSSAETKRKEQRRQNDELERLRFAGREGRGRDGRGRVIVEKDGRVAGLTAAVAVLSVILLLVCAYTILKKRGQICKRGVEETASPVKKRHVVAQDSFSSVKLPNTAI